VGEIGHSNAGSPIIVSKDSRDAVAEQFRILRTGLQFMLNGEKDKVVIFTSSMPGEGKSFVATNLAAALSLAGNKVVLMEMDLRKPKISDGLGISRSTGFSSYIIGKDNLEDILIPHNSHPGLYVMPSGPIPPNPSELLTNNKTRLLFEELRNRFDYIIVDCPPNLVTDSQILGKYADVTLYLVRVGVTQKEQIKIPNDYKRLHKMPNIGLVVNDVKPQRRYGGGYYGYGGYTYYNGKYYGEERKRRKRKKENV
jgi:capsular exopolysaccharide synthesis family protein